MTRARAAPWALATLALLVTLGNSHESTLPASDAAAHAALARESFRTGFPPAVPWGKAADGGDWGELGFNDHPFPFFWLDGAVMAGARRLGIEDAWPARLLTAGFSAGAVAATWHAGRALALLSGATPALAAWTGAFTGFFLLANRAFIKDTTNQHLDTVMAFFLALSLLAWARGRPGSAGAWAGWAVAFKTPLGWATLPAMLLVGGRRLGARGLLRAALPALAIGLGVWAVAATRNGWDPARDYWVRQVFGTAVGGRGAGQAAGFGVLRDTLLHGFFPWGPLVALECALALRRRIFRRASARAGAPLGPGFAYPFATAAVGLTALGLMRFSYGHYAVSLYPALALLAARPAARIIDGWPWMGTQLRRAFVALVAGLALALAVTPLRLAPESFPELRRFFPVLHAGARCGDEVLFLEGGQPYGTAVDYRGLVHFYTGLRLRKVEACEEARSARWALASEEAWARCGGEPAAADRVRWREGAMELRGPSEVPEVDRARGDLRVVDLCAPK